MAPHADDRALRSVNYRLKTTPVKQLPNILHHIAAQLVSASCDVSTASQPEVTWLKTRTTSLLQDRSQEARFCAVVLIKTLLDLGGSDVIVQDKDRIAAWIRGLLDTLKRPGPITTKKCAVVAITKAFMLTWGHATLVRELTTPALPTFITTCLQHVQGTPQIRTPAQSDLIEFVLDSFAQLLPRHPTVFRSFAAQIHGLSIAALSNDPFDDATTIVLPPGAKDAACQLLVLLHQCAQKGGGAAEWEKALGELLGLTHASTDQVFRAVTEDWQSVAGVRSTVVSSRELEDEPQVDADKSSGFPGWTGVRSGVERIQSLLALLQTYLHTPTATSVRLPLGRIVDLVTRLLYVQAPRSRDPVSSRYNVQVGREEREELLALLPEIHTSALDVIYTVLERLDAAALPVCLHFLDLITWLFQAEHFDANVRTACYTCVAQILSIAGLSLGRSTVKSLDKIIKACCKDLLPVHKAPKASEVISANVTNGSKAGKNSNGTNQPTTESSDSLKVTFPGLHAAASDLLHTLFRTLPTTLLSKATRTEMDRTAILTNHTEALAASVLSPAPQKPSLLPFLSTLAPDSAATEAILRPRMPVILNGKHDHTIAEGVEDEEMDDGEEEEEDEEDEEVVGETVDGTREEIQGSTNSSWTIPPPEQPENPQIEWALGTARNEESHEAQHIATSQLGNSAGKRTAEDEASFNSTKKARTEVDQPTAEAGITYEAEDTSRHTEDRPIQVAPASAGADMDDEEDEDGSDFEIPPLVMRTDFDDDDEEEDD